MDFDFGMKRRRLVRLPSVVAAAGLFWPQRPVKLQRQRAPLAPK